MGRSLCWRWKFVEKKVTASWINFLSLRYHCTKTWLNFDVWIILDWSSSLIELAMSLLAKNFAFVSWVCKKKTKDACAVSSPSPSNLCTQFKARSHQFSFYVSHRWPCGYHPMFLMMDSHALVQADRRSDCLFSSTILNTWVSLWSCTGLDLKINFI